MKILIKGGLRFSTLTDDDKPVVSLETKGMDMSVCSVKNCENFNQKRFEDSFQLTISLWFTRSKRNRYVRPPQNKFRIFENQINTTYTCPMILMSVILFSSRKSVLIIIDI